MMQIRIIKPKETATPAKITVHKTGKLGFSKGAMELLELGTYRFAKFGFDEDNKLCILMFKDADEETFSIAKAGAYFYITAKTLLQDLKIDFKSANTTIFDIMKTEEPHIFRLSTRVLTKK